MTFENASQLFYFYMNTFYNGAKFETPEQNRVNYIYLVGIKNKFIIFSKNSSKWGFAIKTEVTNRLFLRVILTSNSS